MGENKFQNGKGGERETILHPMPHARGGGFITLLSPTLIIIDIIIIIFIYIFIYIII